MDRLVDLNRKETIDGEEFRQIEYTDAYLKAAVRADSLTPFTDI